jgi:restriction system protein
VEWLAARLASKTAGGLAGGSLAARHQATLWGETRYDEEAPALRSVAELEAALEHLEYAAQRRYQNELTRAERSRLENSIRNAQFKVERFLDRHPECEPARHRARYAAIRDQILAWRDGMERRQRLARRADLKLGQLASLSAEGFEEFVAEVFESLGFEVECVGGTGDDGIDLNLIRGPLRAIVQCKYHKGSTVIGSPELRRFLGSIHHSRSNKGFFVTTATFSLAAERFAANHPIELVDGPRLVELVEQAMTSIPRRKAGQPLIEFPGDDCGETSSGSTEKLLLDAGLERS